MSLFFFYAVFIVCVMSHYDTETNAWLKNIKIMSAFVTSAVRFVIIKAAVFVMEWVKTSVKSAFLGIIFFYEKIWFQS